MKHYENQTFKDETITLDNNAFSKCKFKNCTLVYGGGPLVFSDNNLNDVSWNFIDSAARTIGLMGSFYSSGGESKKFVEILLLEFGKQAAATEH